MTLILYGLIALMGIKIRIDSRVDFSEQRNLIIAGASLIVATGLGIIGITVGQLNLAGIALGTVLAVLVNALFSLGKKISAR